MGQEAVERRATILYPTLDNAARQQVIFVKEPLRGMAKAQVVLRPVNLLKLDLLLRSKDVQAQRNRAEFAYRLALGTPPIFQPTEIDFLGQSNNHAALQLARTLEVHLPHGAGRYKRGVCAVQTLRFLMWSTLSIYQNTQQRKPRSDSARSGITPRLYLCFAADFGCKTVPGVSGVRRRRPICAEAGRELPSLSGR